MTYSAKTEKFQLILCNVVHRRNDGRINSTPQLGLLYIATVASNGGYDVNIFAGDQIYPEIEKVALNKSKILFGFYTNSDNYPTILRIAKKIKHSYPHSLTILGGPLAKTCDDSLIENDCIDFVGRGDGEFLVLELLNELCLIKPNFDCIDGLTHKKQSSADIFSDQAFLMIQNRPRATLKNLDVLPLPDRDLYPRQSFGITTHVVTSRGCGFRCTFCHESLMNKLQFHSTQRVVAEIRLLRKKFDSKYICFVDDVFTNQPVRVREFCQAFLDEFEPHVDLFWYCEGRVDSLSRNKDLLPLMVKSGLTRLQIGIESGSQRIIDAYKKNITVNQIFDTVVQCNKSNIMSIYTNFILGGALETKESYEKSLTMALELLKMAPGRMEVSCNFLSPYPGTDIFLNPNKYQLLLNPSFQSKSPSEHFRTDLSDGYIFCETENLTKQELLECGREFNAQIQKAMFDIASQLPSSLIRKQLLSGRIGLFTDWAQFFRKDEVFANWDRLMATNAFEYIIETDGQSEYESIFPYRTIDLKSLKNDCFVWPLMRKRIVFKNFEMFLLELCSGKNSIVEILERSYQFVHGTVPKDKLLADIMDYFSDLANQFMLVYRRDLKS